VQTSAKASKLQ